MKRKIIHIDEEKCDGCGQCIPNCPEGALQIIDNKARLISDLFCDGLGACVGTCPTGAMTVLEREAEPYDERRVMGNIVKQGTNVIRAHLEHLKEHGEHQLLDQAISYLNDHGIEVPNLSSGGHVNMREQQHATAGGCPGAAMMDLRKRSKGVPDDGLKISSQLSQWPIQLQLINPQAPYFKEAEILVSADCVPFAYADFHRRFLKDKIMITFCPKLDQTLEQYVEKLTVMFRDNDIKSISVVHMEVPCCSGTLSIVQRALQQAEKIIPVKEYTISISGNII
jgi:NAD-dependent dihydropyrimidine dehydrogenase PreA subunit